MRKKWPKVWASYSKQMDLMNLTICLYSPKASHEGHSEPYRTKPKNYCLGTQLVHYPSTEPWCYLKFFK